MGSAEAGTMARTVVCPARVESAWPGTRVGIESSSGLDVEARLASSVLWEERVGNAGVDDSEGAV